jgi:DNA-binding response OmpR family regulator
MTTIDSSIMPAACPTILIVEDDIALQDLLAALLEDERYRTLRAGTGAEALAQLAARRPDLVLLDLRLPDIDGYELCQRIRATHGAQLPILMLSANRDPRDVIEALHIGATDYLRKPFETEELLLEIRSYLPSAPYAPSAD